MNANREWLSSAPVTAACQRLKADREAEEAEIRARFEKWAIAQNWNVQKGLYRGQYDQQSVTWGWFAFLAVARGEA